MSYYEIDCDFDGPTKELDEGIESMLRAIHARIKSNNYSAEHLDKIAEFRKELQDLQLKLMRL